MDVLPEEVVQAPDDLAAEQRRRRRRRLLWLLIGLLALLLLAIGIVMGYYMTTKKPLTTLPGIRLLTLDTPPGFLFSIYGATQPVGVAVSPDLQRIYVTEGGGEHQVRVFDYQGRALGFLSPPSVKFSARRPAYVAVDLGGRVYVSDVFYNVVQIYGANGKYAGELPRPPGQDSWLPLGVNVDRLGRLYVTDTGETKHRVVVYDEGLRLKREFGKLGNGPGELNFPNALAVDGLGRTFVSNGNNYRVDVFGPDGKLLSDFGSQGTITGLGLPRGIALDDQNRLYVVDSVNNDVAVFDVGTATAKPLFTLGGYGGGEGAFRFPNGLAIDSGGRIYVADRENNRVEVWAY